METDLNIYAAPTTKLLSSSVETPRFYVVSPRKFLVLFFFTMGAYVVYWMYKNWDCFKKATSRNIMPFMRCLFPIFFIHALFKEVENTLSMNKIEHAWKPFGLATFYVIIQIAGYCNLFFESTNLVLDVVLFLFTLSVTCWVFYQGQLAVNAACDQPNGDCNRVLTLGNYVWIVLGLLMWRDLIVALYLKTTR